MGSSTLATSTEMVNALFNNTGQLLTDFTPYLYLFFGTFLGILAFGIMVRTFRRGIRRSTR